MRNWIDVHVQLPNPMEKVYLMCGSTENEYGKVLTFYTKIFGEPMMFKVSSKGFFITCMNPSREVVYGK